MAEAIDYTQILFDASGKPYWRRQDGGKVYLPPLAAMQSNNPRAVQWAKSMGVSMDGGGQVINQGAPGASFAKERGHWDSGEGEWDQDTDWANIVTTALAGIPLAAGGAAALQGGAAPASGALPSSTIPNAHLAVPGAIGSQGASQAVNGLAPLASNSIPGLHNAVPPGGMTPQNTSAGVPSGGVLPDGAGGGPLDALKKFFTNPDDLAGLAGVIAGLTGVAGGGGGESEEAKRLHQITEARMRRVDPLHQAVTQLAWGRLPINSRNGIAAPVPSPLPEPR